MSDAVYVIEGGNTRVHHGCYVEGAMRSVRHTEYPSNAANFDDVIDDILREYRRWGAPRKITIATVSARWGQRLVEELREAIERDILVIHSASEIGLNVLYTEPETYGVDRALAALGAYTHTGMACVVIDAGTAVTVDAVNEEGVVAGGFIFPGLRMTGESLSRLTSLPVVDSRVGNARIGVSTEAGIANASLTGWVAAVERLASIAQEAVEARGPVVLTGGDADILAGSLQRSSVVIPELTLCTLGRVSAMPPRGT